MVATLTKVQAIQYLGISQKQFDNYFSYSGEIKGYKSKGRWYFRKATLDKWNNLRKARTVSLNLMEYEKCFEFAIKMAYSGGSSHGTGIRGARSEVQVADDFILGILAEHGLQKFLKDKFNCRVKLDMKVHPDHITPQDIIKVRVEKNKWRDPKLCVAVKSSKMKSCYNVIDPLEYENLNRRSDVYIFARVDLPSDHLFRILREHSFFKKVKDYLDVHHRFQKIEELNKIGVWICGYSKHRSFKKVTEIPGQKFELYRYVKNVAGMKNSDADWINLISEF